MTTYSQNYINARYKLISKEEGFCASLYLDTEGFITTGIGFLVAHAFSSNNAKPTYDPETAHNTELTDFIGAYTSTQKAVFSAYAAAVDSLPVGYSFPSISHLSDFLKSTFGQALSKSLTIKSISNQWIITSVLINGVWTPVEPVFPSQSSSEAFFNNSVTSYENMVNSYLSSYPSLKITEAQRLGLLSVCYNRPANVGAAIADLAAGASYATILSAISYHRPKDSATIAREKVEANLIFGNSPLPYSTSTASDTRQLTNLNQLLAYTDTGDILDPLLLDLSTDGSGITTTALYAANSSSSSTHFDYNNNGFSEATAWAGSSTGILVYLPDGSSTDITGQNLLGNTTLLPNGAQAVNGFSALQELAGMSTGTLDSSNPLWSQLWVWVNGQLETLADVGIVSIGLQSAYGSGQPDSSGNIPLSTGTFSFEDGSARTMADYSLKVNPTDTWEDAVLPLTAEIATLPEIVATGTVYDLSQAMSRDGSLTSLVESFQLTTSIQAANTIVAQIIQEWTGANQVVEDSSSNFMDARQLYVVEQFRGANFTDADIAALNNNGLGTATQQLATTYQQIYNYIFGALVAQSQLSNLWDGQPFNMSNDGQVANDPDFVTAAAFFDDLLTTDVGTAANTLALFAQALNGLGLTSAPGYADFKNQILSEAPDIGQVLSAFDGTGGVPIEMGTDTVSQVISGTNTNGFLFGFSGNDSFKSNGGNTLEDFGTGGNDVYEVASGDVIKDSTGGGSVWFNGEKLTGGQWNPSTNQFESPDFDYQVVGGNSLKVVSVADPSQSVTIDNVPLAQNPDGSFSLSGGTYLGINLSEPTSGPVTYDISRTDGYTQTLIQGFQHPIDYGVWTPDGLNVLQPQGHYNLVLTDLNPDEIYVKEDTISYNPQYYYDLTGYNYDIYIKSAYTPYGFDDLWVKMTDGADPSGVDPVLDTITFADGETYTLGQLLSMPQIGLPTSPTISVDGSQSSISQAGINATYQIAALQSNVSLTGFESSATSSDQLTFTSTVSESNLTFSQSGTDLLVTNLQTGAVLQVNNYLGPDTDPSVAKSIQFADGTSLSYADLVSSIENGVTPTITTGADLLQLTSTSENGDGTYSLDLSGAEAYIDNLIATNDPTASTMLAQFAQALQPLESKGLVDYQAFREHYVSEGQQYAWVIDTGETSAPTPEYQYAVENDESYGVVRIGGNTWMDSVSFTALVDDWGSLTLYGNSGREILTESNPDPTMPLTVVAGTGSITFNASGTSGKDVFDGGAGDNVFTGGTGTNFFSSHGGNDVDNGGQGANTYYLSAGFGQVVINNTLRSVQSNGPDVIKFDSSLTEDDIGFTQEGNDLLITDDYGDQALVKGYFSSPDSNGNAQTVGTIQFSDGTSLSASDMTYWADPSTQTDSSTLSAADDDVAGGSTLVAWSTGSTLIGGSGGDTLLGGAGDDTLIAGTGDDYMSGKEGTNTYVFGLNIGNDVVDNAAALGYGTNVIQFVDGITADQLSFSQSGDDLVITMAGGTGSITVKQFFEDSITEGANPLISEIAFGDGSTWSAAQLFTALEVATNQHPEAWGFATVNNPLYPWDTTSYVTATGGNVVLYGGDAYDNTIDTGSAANATIYTDVDNGINGYAIPGSENQLVNTIYTEGTNTTIHLGIEASGETSDTVVFGSGNNDLYISDNAGYVGVSNVTLGNNVLHFASDVTFQQLMTVNVSWQATLQIGGNYLAMENNSDGSWSWYYPYYVSFANDGVSAVLADGHIFDTTFYRQWVDGKISVQYGSATSGQSETLVSSDWGSAALFAGNGEETLEATGNTAWMFGGSGDNYFYGNINGLYSGGSGYNYINAGSGTSVIDGGFGTSTINLNWNTNSRALVRVDKGGGDNTINLGQGTAEIQFGVGISLSDLSFSVNNSDDMEVTVTSTGQTLSFTNWFQQQTAPSVSFTFHDGSTLSYANVNQLLPQSGAVGDVTIIATPGSTDLYAGSGNDVLNSSYYGNETIETGSGNDIVNLNGGSHVVTIGTGDTSVNNDSWYGSGNAETLVVNADSGSVVYKDNTNGSAPLTIELGSGIAESALAAALIYDLISELSPMGNWTQQTGDVNLAIAGGPTIDLVSALQQYGTQPDLPTIDFADGTTWSSQQLQTMLTAPLTSASEAILAAGTNSAITNGSVPTVAASDTQALFSYTDGDIIEGSSSVQAIIANAGHAIIQGNGGDTDIIAYSPENSNYNSTTGTWVVTESPDLVDGGSGNSTITLTDGIVLAQKGSSSMTLEGNSAVLLYDAGDGVDTVQSWSQNLTLSFGGGLSWTDVSLEQAGNDLVLDIGSSGKIDLQNYFQNPGANIQLQMFEGSDSSGVHAELANLSSIVTAFEAAGPQTTPWSLENALTNLALTAENNQAYGGDVAAYYALNGTLGGLSTDIVQAALQSPAFGATQSLTAPSQWQSGKYQLVA